MWTSRSALDLMPAKQSTGKRQKKVSSQKQKEEEKKKEGPADCRVRGPGLGELPSLAARWGGFAPVNSGERRKANLTPAWRHGPWREAACVHPPCLSRCSVITEPPKYPQGGPIFLFVTVKATTAKVNGLSSLAAFFLFQFESLDTGHSLCHAPSPTSHSLLADQEAPDLEHLPARNFQPLLKASTVLCKQEPWWGRELSAGTQRSSHLCWEPPNHDKRFLLSLWSEGVERNAYKLWFIASLFPEGL